MARRSAIRQRLLIRNALPAKTFTPVASNADGEVLTAAAYRGKGVASALVLHLIEEARQRNMSELWLYTPDQQAFYCRYGWQEVEQRIVSAEQVSVMRLSIFSGEDN